MGSKWNQAVTMEPVFFDPIGKKAVAEDLEDGSKWLYYVEDRPAVAVEENGDVTFSMYAPCAQSVEVAGISGSMSRERVALEKTKDGYFCGTVSGIRPGFHYYHYLVNGTAVVDPNGRMGYGGFQAVNFVEVLEKEFEEYRLRQVPHGAIHLNYYKCGEQDGLYPDTRKNVDLVTGLIRSDIRPTMFR